MPARAPLRPHRDQKQVRRPVHLGRWVAIVLAGGTVVLAGQALLAVRSGADALSAVSVAASAFAALAVSLLALVALINLVAGLSRGTYVWILPPDFPELSTDRLVPAALLAGLLIGKLLWH